MGLQQLPRITSAVRQSSSARPSQRGTQMRQMAPLVMRRPMRRSGARSCGVRWSTGVPRLPAAAVTIPHGDRPGSDKPGRHQSADRTTDLSPERRIYHRNDSVRTGRARQKPRNEIDRHLCLVTLEPAADAGETIRCSPRTIRCSPRFIACSAGANDKGFCYRVLEHSHKKCFL